MHDQSTFASWLRQRRKALDLTQAQLAQQAGCSLSAIRQLGGVCCALPAAWLNSWPNSSRFDKLLEGSCAALLDLLNICAILCSKAQASAER
jgi:transcriptional regulator with XRE-family HTH domain